MALIASSSGSSLGSIQRRRIMMLVSSRPCWWRSLVIRAGLVVIGCGVLAGAERLNAGGSGAAGHGGELLPGDEAAALPQRDQLADLVAVPGDGERLPVAVIALRSSPVCLGSSSWHA